MSTPRIRPAVAADLPGMLVLMTHLNPADPVADGAAVRHAWSALLAAGTITVLVAEDADGTLVATCTLVIVPNLSRGARSYAVIENVVAHADHRRRGLGRAVLRAALDRAWEAGCYKVMLSTGRKDESTHRFYESAGSARGTKTHFEARRL